MQCEICVICFNVHFTLFVSVFMMSICDTRINERPVVYGIPHKQVFFNCIMVICVLYLPHGAVGWLEVCDYGIFWSVLLLNVETLSCIVSINSKQWIPISN